MHSFIQLLVDFVSDIGYLGLFIGMFLESTLIPIPAELVMIPAGIAAQQGVINIYFAMLAGVAGNVAGAVFSYYLALSIGRRILLKIGKYFFIKPETIIRIERFFGQHGHISVFIGRLLPGFRHFISLPAGLAKMDMRLFLVYTTLGSTIWDAVLVGLGFFIGANQELIHKNLHLIMIAAFAICATIAAIYIRCRKFCR
ncbi:MAG: DedA family protein [Alphaproteobacteria bacterium]|nr:DedA family protein [Alphaproteobacteria bacterium]